MPFILDLSFCKATPAITKTFIASLLLVFFLGLLSACSSSDSDSDDNIPPAANTAPIADAGETQTVSSGATVSLDGSGSADSDGDSLSFAWTLTSQPDGSGAALSDAAIVNPAFVADQPGTYVAQLIVSDGRQDSAPASVTLTATEPVLTVSADVVGQTQAAAEQTISDAGLSLGDVTRQSSDTVPTNDVISQQPTAGESVTPGSTVDLVISSGPATSTPPSDSSQANSAKLSVFSVSASDDDGNVPANTLDENLVTRWSSNGSGRYITYDLGSVKSISSMKIAWYKGDQRKAYFEIRVGTTTASLSTVYDAKTTGSSGSTFQLETYDFDQVSARYVRIIGFGNSNDIWNSLTEAEIWGESSGDPNDTIPPGSISNLSASEGNGQVSLSWSNPPDLDFDHVKISYSGESVTTSSENRTITGLTNGNSYTFTVAAFDGSGNRSSSKSINATPMGGSSGTTPFYIINLQDAWKITLPKDDDNDNNADEIFIDASQNDIQSDGSLKDYEDNSYFYTDGTWVYFKCQGNGETTGSSNNPRSELREMTNRGATQANWNMTTGSANTMEFTVKIMQTSESRKLAFAQIHAESGSSWDDILRIQIQSDIAYAQVGDTGHIYIMGSGNNDGHDIIINNYTLGDELNLKIIAKNSQYKVYLDNVEVYASETNISSTGNYFKVGNYLQSVTSSGTGGKGIVAFNKILVY